MTFAKSLWSWAPQALLLLVALFWTWFDPGGAIERQRRTVFDYYQRIEPRPYRDAGVRIVDVDDASLARVGQWPWPRTALAAMVQRLSASGAAAIAFDFVFSEPDRTSPTQVIEVWRAEGVPVDKLKPDLAIVPDHDIALANAIRDAKNVVSGFALTPERGGIAPLLKAGIATLGSDPRPFVPGYRGAVADLPAIQRANAGNGSLSFTPDSDFVVRRVPLIERLNNRLYPSLATEALRVAQGASSLLVKSTGASGEYGSGSEQGIVAVRIGAAVVPTDAEGALFLHYTGDAPQRTIAAWRLFADDFDPASVRGKIVLIGTSAAGLRDIRPSPLDPVMPGVEAHAQALEQMLLGDYLERPDWAHAAEFLFILVFGTLLILLLRRTGAVLTGAVAAVAMAGIAAGSWHAYSAYRMLFDPVTPSLAVFAVYIVSTLTGYLRTEAEKRQVRGAFAQYLSPALVEELTRDPSRLKLGGDAREMTFLFCDIRGFTRISERFQENPHALTTLLNRFLTPMTDVILKRRGTIDKYIGDCVMAFWNAPLDDPDHARNACASALAMMAALDDLNRQFEAEKAGYPPLRVGIGLNTGICVVGNMGSDQRFDYSAIGDCVNLASRLEGQTKTYGVAIIVSEATAAAIPAWALLELDLIVVTGRDDAVRIFTLLGDETAAGAGFMSLRQDHDAMLAAYRARRWREARAALERCRKTADVRLSQYYALFEARVAAYETDPPPEDWNGVYVANAK